MKRNNWNMTCPFCGEDVEYWPNCAPSTCKDYWDYAWTVTKRKTRQFFHKTCYYKHTIKVRRENEKTNQTC